jgi:hypothetical protein
MLDFPSKLIKKYIKKNDNNDVKKKQQIRTRKSNYFIYLYMIQRKRESNKVSESE